MISSEDTIGKAAELLRVSGLPELPVVDAWHVVGKVTEASILNALTAEDPKSVAEQPIGKVVSQHVVCANQYMSIAQVAEVMKDPDLAVIPVIDEYGRYLGVAARSDITSALCLTIRPPAVAGMATPLGVYLTTGHIRAGAGDLGLFLAGVLLMLMRVAAVGIVYGSAWALDRIHAFAPWSLLGVLHSIPIFMILLRVLPISGYHAAEHQVVHAIENGEPLRSPNVAHMPRVHPRCGTNIVAAAILFLMVAEIFSTETAMLIAIFVLVFTWRILGAYTQFYITTKSPTTRQLESGIKAGESLLEQYRKHPGYRVTGWRRIWNTGMPQVMLGAAVTMAVEEMVRTAAGRFF
ncbi:MAG: DUF1385 domain-containing protein [Armatimonadetes bacterium]|nr:DUF1385 domain-containing protein [Armatimonadota bacterium]